MSCPRCKKEDINIFRVKRSGIYMNISKCKVCGFLFIEDENLLELAKAEVHKLFIEDLRKIGK
jgi:transcription elongation factor Elf1